MSKPGPSLRQTDHNRFLYKNILYKYKPLVPKQPVTKRTVRKWQREAEEAL